MKKMPKAMRRLLLSLFGRTAQAPVCLPGSAADASRPEGARPRGFTLIELLVVMSIVALLLTLALPRYFGSLERSRETVLQENLKILRATIDKFYADKGRYPEELAELAAQKYLYAVPPDPITETERSWVIVPAQETDQKGIADVKSGAPGKDSRGRLYDSY